MNAQLSWFSRISLERAGLRLDQCATFVEARPVIELHEFCCRPTPFCGADNVHSLDGKLLDPVRPVGMKQGNNCTNSNYRRATGTKISEHELWHYLTSLRKRYQLPQKGRSS